MSLLIRPTLLASLICLLTWSTFSPAASEQRLSYAEQLGPLLILSDPKFDRLQGIYLVCEANTSHACPGVEISLVDGKQVRPLKIAANCRVDVPITQELADRGAEFLFQKPDRAPKCQIFANVTAKLPAGLEWRYRDLSVFGEQLQEYIKHSSGVLSLFAPKLRGLLIRFDKGDAAKLTIHAKSGEIALQSTDGELRLPIDKRLVEENPTVTLSVPPLTVDGWLDD